MLILAFSCLPRFRTYFHEQHRPDVNDFLPSRTYANLLDGKSLFEKVCSEKVRPFTEEEDRALRAGYGGRGTIWAQIVKDSIIQEQRRLSVDLRGLVNTLPGLYEGTGYDPWLVPKKAGVMGEISPERDDQLPFVLVGSSKRTRTNVDESFLGSGINDTPQSATDSDNAFLRSGSRDSSRGSVTTLLLVIPVQLPQYDPGFASNIGPFSSGTSVPSNPWCEWEATNLFPRFALRVSISS